jgi:hypothetical protein
MASLDNFEKRFRKVQKSLRYIEILESIGVASLNKEEASKVSDSKQKLYL